MLSNELSFPYITVGIIAKNEAKNIENTLKYLMEQSYPHEFFEIIIADGNSSDGTREIAEKCLRKGDIVYTVINEKDQPNTDGGYSYGHSFARNVIIDHIDPRSVYIAWIDADCRADSEWLVSLVEVMEDNTDPQVVGAGGRRIVETGKNISKKELMLNYYFTSHIMSLGNPAFSESDVIYMPSIAGYNSIYRADILKKYRYNTKYAFNTDDIEINFRLTQDSYTFLNAKEAKIYHRMDPSISLFLKQMRSYGK
jgi:glycosyltransferase involved in cell wall biosynthesis